MSYFVIKPTAVKLGYVAFTKDVVLTQANGKQACANKLAAEGTRFTFGQDAAVGYDYCTPPYAVQSDLEHVLATDSTGAARQIDMKYFQGGTKMFLGENGCIFFVACFRSSDLNSGRSLRCIYPQ